MTLARAEDALQRRAVRYDKRGDQHYDLVSAWIKATRGSDPDASLYYLAVMLEGGEDPRFIVRRMVIFASEDIGNADPQALSVAVAAAQAVEHVGMPEARYALAQAAVYLALAPKSNAAGRALPPRAPTSASTARRRRRRSCARPPARQGRGRLRLPARQSRPRLTPRRSSMPAGLEGTAVLRAATSTRTRSASGRARPTRSEGAARRRQRSASDGARRPASPRSSRERAGPAALGAAAAAATARATCAARPRRSSTSSTSWPAVLGASRGRERAEVAALELLPAIDALQLARRRAARGRCAAAPGACRARQPLATRARVAYEPLGVVGIVGAGDAPFAQPLGQIARRAAGRQRRRAQAVAARAGRRGERIARLFARAGLPEGLLAVAPGGDDVGRALVGDAGHREGRVHGHPVHRAGGRARRRPGRRGGRAGDRGRRRGARARGRRDPAGRARRGQRGVRRRRPDARRAAPRLRAPRPSTTHGSTRSARRRASWRRSPIPERAAARRRGGGRGRPACVAGGPEPGAAAGAPVVLAGVTARDARRPGPAPTAPLLAVTRVASTDEAIAAVQELPAGPGTSVWTADRYEGERIARALHTGATWLNDHRVVPALPAAPWGGAGGEDALRAFADPRVMTWEPPAGGALLVGSRTTRPSSAPARAVAELRSVRDRDRERALRHGPLPLAKVVARALRR